MVIFHYNIDALKNLNAGMINDSISSFTLVPDTEIG